jgi:hypothetical protein
MTILLFAGLTTARAADPIPNPGFVVLVAQLDEAKGNDWYCTDVAGSEVLTDSFLQAHTCKEPTHDELFETNSPSVGNIYVSDHNLCLTAARVTAGSEIIVTPCDSLDTRQQWVSTAGGQIQPVDDPTLCWTVDTKLIGAPAGASNDHLQRAMSLQACADFDAKYTTWLIPGGYVGKGP